MTNHSIRKMTGKDISLVLQWRNDKSVRQYMFNPAEISKEEHTKWFSEKSSKNNQQLLIFENNGDAQGFISFTIKKGGIAEWGFYKSPQSLKGIGYKLGVAALNYAFNELDIYKVNAQVISFNQKSINFHKNLLFTHEGTLRQCYFYNEAYHDIENFGLFSHEWEIFKHE